MFTISGHSLIERQAEQHKYLKVLRCLQMSTNVYIGVYVFVNICLHFPVTAKTEQTRKVLYSRFT